MPEPRTGKLSRIVIVAAIAAVAFAGALALTEPPGPGLDPDSMSYLGAGLSVARGEGLRVPSANWASDDTSAALAHFPPGFSIGIAAGTAAGLTPVNAARLVEALGAAGTVTAVALAANAAGGAVAVLAAVALAVATPAMVVVHASVLSEPLFLALLATITALLAHARRDVRRTLLLGALATAAALVRYAGVSLVAAVVLDALVFPLASAWRERLRRAAIAAALPVVVLGAWTLARAHPAGGGSIRTLGLYTDGLGATLAEGVATSGRWLAPGMELPAGAAVLAIAVLAGLVALFVQRARAAAAGRAPAQELRLYHAVELVAVCYAGVVGASRLLADPGIPLDERLLAPLFVLASLATGVALAAWWRASFAAHRGSAAALLTLGVTASWIGGAVQVDRQAIAAFRADGDDLASREWRLSPLVTWAARAPAGTRIHSNWPAAIWFHTGRATFELPDTLDAETVAAMRTRFTCAPGAILAFRVSSPDFTSPDSLATLLGMVAEERSLSGTVWRMPRADPATARAACAGATAGVPRTIRR